VKFHKLAFDLQKVAENIDLAELVGSEDVQAAAEVVIKKFNLLKSRHKLHQSVG
jgi:hypothetical protein